jgi:hypothetical protein
MIIGKKKKSQVFFGPEDFMKVREQLSLLKKRDPEDRKNTKIVQPMGF